MDHFDDEIDTTPVSDAQTGLPQAAVALRRLSVRDAAPDGVATIEQALDAADVAAGLAAALTHVVAHEPQLITSLAMA